jgi:hypothetical protein
MNIEPENGIFLAGAFESCNFGLKSVLRPSWFLRRLLVSRLRSWSTGLTVLMAVRWSSSIFPG